MFFVRKTILGLETRERHRDRFEKRLSNGRLATLVARSAQKCRDTLGLGRAMKYRREINDNNFDPNPAVHSGESRAYRSIDTIVQPRALHAGNYLRACGLATYTRDASPRFLM